jgi:hypothetical protein
VPAEVVGGRATQRGVGGWGDSLTTVPPVRISNLIDVSRFLAPLIKLRESRAAAAPRPSDR